MPRPRAHIQEAISAADAPSVCAAWNTITAELVKPTRTVTNPAMTAETDRSVAQPRAGAQRPSLHVWSFDQRAAEGHAARGGRRIFDVDPGHGTPDGACDRLRERGDFAGECDALRRLPLQHGREHRQIRWRHGDCIFRIAIRAPACGRAPTYSRASRRTPVPPRPRAPARACRQAVAQRRLRSRCPRWAWRLVSTALGAGPGPLPGRSGWPPSRGRPRIPGVACRREVLPRRRQPRHRQVDARNPHRSRPVLK